MSAPVQLNAEQAEGLQALKRSRDLQRLSAALAAAFPEVAGRLGDRQAELVEHGVARGAAHGLDHTACLARYLACWFMLGAGFEARPEFAWAGELLSAPGRPQGSKVFQLCRRTREELARLAAPGAPGGGGTTSPAAFDTAIAALDAALLPRGVLGSLLPPESIALGEACDTDALDLRLLEPAGGRLNAAYRVVDGQWRRLPADGARPALTLTAGAPTVAGQAPLALPPRLNLMSQPPERGFSRLRLRTRSRSCCDAAVHPLVTLNGPQGLASWRGAHAADVVLNLYAEPTAAPTDDAPQPTIALETSPQLSLLQATSCGLRDSGQALGEQQTQLAVYPAEQHWMRWSREAGPPMAWPQADAVPPPRPAVYRIERDGLALDASRWQAGLEDLDRQLAEGLSRLATAWERESGVSQGRLLAEPSVLAGSAGLTWGWADPAGELSEVPWFRIAGTLELMGCELRLRMGGELELHGSRSRLALHCSAREALHVSFEGKPGDADLLAAIAPARTDFRQPFVLHLESIAPSGQATLAVAAGPVGGALVGSCGLRPRPAGPGLQWFCTLAIEAVSVALQVDDPLLGRHGVVRPLLPEMTLLDWSLG